jgi:hypothetical protein
LSLPPPQAASKPAAERLATSEALRSVNIMMFPFCWVCACVQKRLFRPGDRKSNFRCRDTSEFGLRIIQLSE